jgi:MFS family permease
MKNKLSITKLTIVATLGGLLFGYDTGVIAGTVGSLEVVFVENLSWSSEFLTNLFYGALVSGALIGCIIGGSIAGEIGRIFGRKKGLVLAGVLFLLSAIGSSFPEIPFSKLGVNTDQFALLFIFYRVIGGIGVGIASMLSPVYISEIAPASIRGKLVSYNQLAIVAGFMIVYFVNAGIGQSGDEWGWAPLPSLSSNSGGPNFMIAIGTTMSVNAAAKNKDGAIDVLNWIMSNKDVVIDIASDFQFGEFVVPLLLDDSDIPSTISPQVTSYLNEYARITGEGNYGYCTWTFWPAEPGVHIWKDMEVVWAGDISVEDFMYDHQKMWDKARKKNETLPVPLRD